MIFKVTSKDINLLQEYLSKFKGLFDGQFDFDINQSELARGLISQLKLDNEEFINLILIESNVVKGALLSHPLSWDTQHFKLKTHRINTLIADAKEAYDKLLFKYVGELSKKGYEYVVYRLPVNHDEVHNYLCLQKFKFLLHKTMLRCDLKKISTTSISNDLSFEIFESKYEERLLNLAADVIKINRFYLDPIIPKQFVPDVYSGWVSSFIKNSPENLKVACCKNQIIGFYLFSNINEENKHINFQDLKAGFVGLIAVDKNFKGFGKYLLNDLNANLKKQDFNISYANTALKNIPSLMMFQNQGYKVFSIVSEYSLYIG
ncbi:MAG: GNAT family N-acetyltransferase [Chitinophagaceae bacterium]